jgi:hypothetical protein
MSTIFFCPFCGRQSPDDELVCLRCGKPLDHWREFPYEERLLLTLHHPIREHRMMAVRILGQRRYDRAVPLFEEMIKNGQDVYTLRGIVYALSQIDTHNCRRLIAKLREHPSPVVRMASDETNGTSPEGASR